MRYLNSQKGIAPIIAIIVLAVFFIGVGTYILGVKKTQAPVQKVVAQPSPVDETANWKTYANAQYGFSIKYPADTQCGQFSENSNGGFNFGRIEIAIYYPEGLDLKSFVDDYLSRNVSGRFNTIESKKQVNINAGNAVTVAYRFGGTNGYGEETFLENKRNVYGIGFTAGAFKCNEPQIFSDMLSTFKFTDQNQTIDATTLETYTNSKYGFQLSFPDSWKGYSVTESSWSGNMMQHDPSALTTSMGPFDLGPLITFQDPKWTVDNQLQSIPIMVITPDLWKLMQEGKLSVSVSGNVPSEVGRNQKFIFATEPRWYGFLTVVDPKQTQEAVDIVKTFKALQ